MKSYNHLWEKLISKENIILAINNSSKGKRDRKSVKRIYENAEYYVSYFQKYAMNFENEKHEPKKIYDGMSRKERYIVVPKYREQVIHHMIVNVLIPIFTNGMYEHTYASLPNRGVHKGKYFIKKWIASDPKNVKYCYKMDIQKFFDSIPHDKLKSMLAKKIHDDRFLDLLFNVIDVTESGLPLGFYTSQWLANWYLQGLDHFIKEDLKAKYYIRYMDDMVIFGSNKRELHRIHDRIEEYMKNELGLNIKHNWQVFRFDYKRSGKSRGRFLDFMGFRFYRDKIILRKKIMIKITRKAKKISAKEKPSIYEIRQMLSYMGWIKSCDVYDMYITRVKPFVDVRKMKKRVSTYDKRQKTMKGA